MGPLDSREIILQAHNGKSVGTNPPSRPQLVEHDLARLMEKFKVTRLDDGFSLEAYHCRFQQYLSARYVPVQTQHL